MTHDRDIYHARSSCCVTPLSGQKPSNRDGKVDATATGLSLTGAARCAIVGWSPVAGALCQCAGTAANLRHWTYWKPETWSLVKLLSKLIIIKKALENSPLLLAEGPIVAQSGYALELLIGLDKSSL